jgi:RimJ/RimL family protein N-acetyltransferase
MRIPGQRIVLRDEPRETDVEDSFRWRNLEEWHYYDDPFTPFRRVIGREEWDRRRRERQKAPHKPFTTSHCWEIDTAKGRHIGWILYYDLDEQAGRATIGIGLPEEAMWGQGYGSEAVRLLRDYVFEVMGLAEVRTETWTGNVRMMRVAKKCGFHEIERYPHEARVTVRGAPLVIVTFALARAEWLEQKEDDL